MIFQQEKIFIEPYEILFCFSAKEFRRQLIRFNLIAFFFSNPGNLTCLIELKYYEMSRNGFKIFNWIRNILFRYEINESDSHENFLQIQ